jgi:histidine triad (HIT) family protein
MRAAASSSEAHTLVDCTFCRIAAGKLAAPIVFEDERTLAFLDHRPVFHGHTLLIPRVHPETLADLPPELVEPLFGNAQRLAAAVERAMDAEGTFVGMNNKVSQSVPHLHIHIIPRRNGDGLRGFFWPRVKYASAEEMREVQDRIRAALQP